MRAISFAQFRITTLAEAEGLHPLEPAAPAPVPTSVCARFTGCDRYGVSLKSCQIPAQPVQSLRSLRVCARVSEVRCEGTLVSVPLNLGFQRMPAVCEFGCSCRSRASSRRVPVGCGTPRSIGLDCSPLRRSCLPLCQRQRGLGLLRVGRVIDTSEAARSVSEQSAADFEVPCPRARESLSLRLFARGRKLCSDARGRE